MGWFSKKVQQNTPSVSSQVALALKSFTLPEVQPTWHLFAKKDRLWNADTAILEGYNASAAVYACVEARAKLVSSVPWKAVMKKRDGETEQLGLDHPLNKLIERPNPDTSWLEVMYEWSQSLDLAGNGYATIIKGGVRGVPTALWNIPARGMKIKPGNVKLIDSYEYQWGAQKKTANAEDVIHLRLPNPNDPIFGMPVLMAAGRATDIDRESGNWQKSSFQNRSAGDIHIEVPEGTPQEDVEAIHKALMERQNGPANARRPYVGSFKLNTLNQTAKEMDFVESKKAVWAEICAVFGMSMSNLGFTESVNLANAESMERSLWKNTIIPRLELIKRQLNVQLASEFGEGVYLEYDISGIDSLQENFSELLDNAKKLYDMGFDLKAINKRLEMGFEEEDLPEVMDFEPDDEAQDEEDQQEPDEVVKHILKSVSYGS